METEEKDISMNDIKVFVEKIMAEYNNGNMSQEKVAVLLKGAEAIRRTFKVERELNITQQKFNERFKKK